MCSLLVKVGAPSGSLSVGRAFDDQGVGAGGEPVDGGLGEQGVAHHGEPFGGFPVRGDDGAGAAVPFDDQFVEVVGLGGVEGFEREVVEDEDVDAGEFADLGVQGVVQPGGAEPGEQLVGAGGVDREPAADRDVSERGGEVGLADPDRPEDQDPVAGLVNRRLVRSLSSARS